MIAILKKMLHWLPVRHDIVYKILSLFYKAVNGVVPCYISDLLDYGTSKRTLTSPFSIPSGDPKSETKDLWRKDVLLWRPHDYGTRSHSE